MAEIVMETKSSEQLTTVCGQHENSKEWYITDTVENGI